MTTIFERIEQEIEALISSNKLFVGDKHLTHEQKENFESALTLLNDTVKSLQTADDIIRKIHQQADRRIREDFKKEAGGTGDLVAQNNDITDLRDLIGAQANMQDPYVPLKDDRPEQLNELMKCIDIDVTMLYRFNADFNNSIRQSALALYSNFEQLKLLLRFKG